MCPLYVTYLASLSIWSPNPGVSTMVSEMRVPSSSSSARKSQRACHDGIRMAMMATARPRTNCDGLDLNTLLDMRGGWVVGVLVSEDLLAAEGVDKGCPASPRGTADHQTELDSLLDILLSARLVERLQFTVSGCGQGGDAGNWREAAASCAGRRRGIGGGSYRRHCGYRAMNVVRIWLGN